MGLYIELEDNNYFISMYIRFNSSCFLHSHYAKIFVGCCLLAEKMGQSLQGLLYKEFINYVIDTPQHTLKCTNISQIALTLDIVKEVWNFMLFLFLKCSYIATPF